MQKYYTIGSSTLNIPIFAFEFGLSSQPTALVLGGIHGDEIEGVVLARALTEYLGKNPFPNLRIIVVPEMNPDGVLLKTRGNGNGVDLNRNLPTQDWSPEVKTLRYHPGPSAGSEIENQILMKLIATEAPKVIISLHSWHPVLNVNGDCLPEAQSISEHTGYRVDTDIGYPTPGCLGTYTGLERNIGTLTYEIERGQAPAQIPSFHLPGLIAALKQTQSRFNK